jgi:hypothetical protein
MERILAHRIVREVSHDVERAGRLAQETIFRCILGEKQLKKEPVEIAAECQAMPSTGAAQALKVNA